MTKARKKRSARAFDRALSAAKKRLAHAIPDREAARQLLLALDAEIPALQRTIAALQQQLKPISSAVMGEQEAARLPHPAIPADLAPYVGPQDLTGMGSVPASGPIEPQPQTEDDLLPEPEGTPLLEK